MEIIAHRGMHGNGIRENSRDALRACIGSKADGVEIDVRITADDICVVHHNTKLQSRDRVSSLSFEQLNKIDSDLIRINDALDILKDFDGIINLEVKHLLGERGRSRGLACVAKLATEINAQHPDLIDRVVVSSFSLPNVKNLSLHLPAVTRAYLAPRPLSFRRALARASNLGCNAIHFSLSQMRKPRFAEVVNHAHNNGLKVRVYTVNDVEDFLHAKRLVVDGVFTDEVEKLANTKS